MRKAKPADGRRKSVRHKPSREAKDLLSGFGHLERRDASVRPALSREKLPRYLCDLQVVKETHRRVMVISSDRQTGHYIKRGQVKLLALQEVRG